MPTIITKSNKANREIETEAPEILNMTNMSDIVGALGEDLAVRTIQAQLTVSYRSHIRTKLESMTDGEINYTDDVIKEMDFSDWKPEARVRKSSAEKAADLLGKLSPEELKAAFAAAGIE